MRRTVTALAALALLMASLSAGWWLNNKYGKPRTERRWNPVYRAMPTPAAEKWRTEIVERTVRVPVLTAREAARIEDEWDLDVAGPGEDRGNSPASPETPYGVVIDPAPPVEVLGEWELVPLPDGGWALVTLRQDGAVELIVRHKKPPLVRTPLKPYVRFGSGLYVPLQGEAQPAWMAMLGADLLELPRLRTTLSAEAGWLDLGDRRGWLVVGTVRVGL